MTTTRSANPKHGGALALLLTHGLLALCLFVPELDAQVTGVAGRAANRSGTPPALPATVTWSFDESTSGADIAWSSPTAIDPTAMGFYVRFSIDTVEVSASFIGIPLGSFDVTDQLPPELLVNSSAIAGPAPVQLLNQPVVAPPPPDPVALGATLSMGIDATGHGQLQATNVVLGTTLIDVGAPFGVVNVTITGFRIAGTISVTPLPWRILPL